MYYFTNPKLSLIWTRAGLISLSYNALYILVSRQVYITLTVLMAWPDTDWSISLLNKSDNKVQGWINPKNVRESVCGGEGEKGDCQVKGDRCLGLAQLTEIWLRPAKHVASSVYQDSYVCSQGFVCTCCVLRGSCVLAVFSGVRVYLLCSQGFVCTCCVLRGSCVLVVFSWRGLYVFVVFSGVHVTNI